MHLLHRITKLHAEPRENVALPRVVLGVYARLHLLVIDDANPKLLLRLRRVERRARALDLRQELLPIGERVAEAVEDVFCLEVPERLELQPFRDVVFQLLDFGLDEHEWSLQRVIGELRELEKESVSMRSVQVGSILMKYTTSLMPRCPASGVQSHTANSESAVAGKPHLERHQ